MFRLIVLVSYSIHLCYSSLFIIKSIHVLARMSPNPTLLCPSSRFPPSVHCRIKLMWTDLSSETRIFSHVIEWLWANRLNLRGIFSFYGVQILSSSLLSLLPSLILVLPHSLPLLSREILFLSFIQMLCCLSLCHY